MLNRSVRVNNMFRRTPLIYHIKRYSRNIKNDVNYNYTSFVIIQDGTYVEERFLNKAFNLDNIGRFFKCVINTGEIFYYSTKIPKLNKISEDEYYYD